MRIPTQEIIGTTYLSDRHGVFLKEKLDQLIVFARNPTISDKKKMEKFYGFIDMALDKFDVKNKSVCKSGCSHCCYVDVSVTWVEAAYITANTGIEYNRIKKRQRNGYHKTKTPCTFLVDDKCSIYEFRPLACRMFFTLDSADFCADETNPRHVVFQIESWGTAVKLYTELARTCNFALADIRELFTREKINEQRRV